MDSKQAYLQCLERLIWALDRLEAKVEPSEVARIAETDCSADDGALAVFSHSRTYF